MLSSASTNQENPSAAFLHRAAHDPEFRAALEANPRAALTDCGLSAGTEQIPSMVTLPSAESILDVLIDVEEDRGDHRGLPPWHGFFRS